MLYGGLFFAIALGIFGLAFRSYAMRQSQFDPALMLALGGGALLGLAMMTFVWAMYSFCHGEYDILRDVTACTPVNHKAHGMQDAGYH